MREMLLWSAVSRQEAIQEAIQKRWRQPFRNHSGNHSESLAPTVQETIQKRWLRRSRHEVPEGASVHAVHWRVEDVAHSQRIPSCKAFGCFSAARPCGRSVRGVSRNRRSLKASRVRGPGWASQGPRVSLWAQGVCGCRADRPCEG
eukprot:2924657-Pyramimonas_sp.AAC.1